MKPLERQGGHIWHEKCHSSSRIDLEDIKQNICQILLFQFQYMSLRDFLRRNLLEFCEYYDFYQDFQVLDYEGVSFSRRLQNIS